MKSHVSQGKDGGWRAPLLYERRSALLGEKYEHPTCGMDRSLFPCREMVGLQVM
jgi:hypothetical protein